MLRTRFIFAVVVLVAGVRAPVFAASCIRILKNTEAELMEGPQAMSKPKDETRIPAQEDPNASPPPPVLMETGAGAPEPNQTQAPQPPETPPLEAGKTVPLIETEVRPVQIQSSDSTITEEPIPLPVSPPQPQSGVTDIEPQPLEPIEPIPIEPIPIEPAKPVITMLVKSGQIYAGIGPDETGKFVKIKSDRKTYLVPIENTSVIAALDTCNEQPVCLVAKRSSFAIKNLADPEKRKISFRRNDKIPTVASRITQKKEKYFLTFFEKDYYWVKSRDVATYSNKTCDEVRDMILPDGGLEDPVAGPVTSRYSLGFEAGYGMGYSAKDYSNFITEVPDSSNVGPLSNPIITEVKKGKGFYIGPLLEVQITEAYKLKFAAQYQEKSYTYSGKENPTIAPNSLDSLPDVTGTFKDQSIQFSIAPAFEFGGPTHRFGLGGQLRTFYYISKPSSLTYRVGSVFKATEVTIEGGPKGFQNLFLLNGYYQWQFDKASHLRLRTTIETDGSIFNLGLAAFY
jgi:hypothetical protein